MFKATDRSKQLAEQRISMYFKTSACLLLISALTRPPTRTSEGNNKQVQSRLQLKDPTKLIPTCTIAGDELFGAGGLLSNRPWLIACSANRKLILRAWRACCAKSEDIVPER